VRRPKTAAHAKRRPTIKRGPYSNTREGVQPPPDGAMVLTIKQTAAAMQCSTPVVYKRIREGVIKAYRVGEVIRIDPESVRQFLFSRPIPPTAGHKLAG
jgi:excisionase family DNA binding protein